MAKNVMAEVAKALGLELGEEFSIGDTDKYVLLDDGLFKTIGKLTYWQVSIENLLTGEWDVVKLPKPILDAKEKEFLSALVKPKNIRNRILYIAKDECVKTYENPNAKIYECIYIMYKDSSKKRNPFYMGFPCFEKGTMYKGMELNKEYTLEELGL